MAQKIEDINSPTKLRQEIHHARTAEHAQAAMRRLEAITPEKDQAALKGIRDATARKVKKLGGAADTPSSGKSNISGKEEPKPSGKAAWSEGKLRRAMRNDGDPEAHTILKGRGRVNGSDERAYQKAVEKKQEQAAGGGSKPKLSRRDEKRLRTSAQRGDSRAMDTLRDAGKATSIDEQQFTNARSRNSGGGWTGGSSSSRKSQDETWLGAMLKNVPEERQDKIRKQAETTIKTLRGDGVPDEIIGQVLDQYKDKANLSQAHREANELRRKWAEEAGEKGEGRGR